VVSDTAGLPEAEAALEIARLAARVERLERLLSERSRLLRDLTPELCPDDLANLSRLAAGLPPLARAAFGLSDWRETTALSAGDVDKTMEQLWRSLGARPRDEE
jgi:hypothetical protein